MFILSILLLSTLASARIYNANTIPKPKGDLWVVDPDRHLTSHQLREINSYLDRDSRLNRYLFYYANSDSYAPYEVSIVIVDKVSGNVKTTANNYFNRIGLGYKNCNNGVLLFLSIEDREVVVQPGTGVRYLSSQDRVNVINRMIPHLFSDEVYRAVLEGTEQLTQTLVDNSLKDMKFIERTDSSSYLFVKSCVLLAIVFFLPFFFDIVLVSFFLRFFLSRSSYLTFKNRWNSRFYPRFVRYYYYPVSFAYRTAFPTRSVKKDPNNEYSYYSERKRDNKKTVTVSLRPALTTSSEYNYYSKNNTSKSAYSSSYADVKVETKKGGIADKQAATSVKYAKDTEYSKGTDKDINKTKDTKVESKDKEESKEIKIETKKGGVTDKQEATSVKYAKDTDKDTVKGTDKDTVKGTDKGTDKDTVKGTDKDTVKGTDKDINKDLETKEESKVKVETKKGGTADKQEATSVKYDKDDQDKKDDQKDKDDENNRDKKVSESENNKKKSRKSVVAELEDATSIKW